MDKVLNKEILRLSLPSILANLTVPLVGIVDTAVAGHLSGGNAALFIGAISIGAMLFNLLYWNFGFLRTGTGGLTAQAFGRQDPNRCAAICIRGLGIALAMAALTLVLRNPFLKLALFCVDGTDEVEALAAEYFSIRIWAAPATLSLMTFSGWFVGMQDSMSSMWKDLIINGINIIASVVLSFGAFGWEGLGFRGIALGTLIAQYSGMAFCIAVCIIKYWKSTFSTFRMEQLGALFAPVNLRGFFKMNLDLFGRSLCFTLIYIGYTMLAAGLGDLLLACSSIMMQLLMIFSYFTDGFAYAGEALTGRFIGAQDQTMKTRTIKYVFVWSMAIAFLFVFIYAAAGTPLLKMLTDSEEVIEACREFLPWLILMPPLGCAAFTWDGIYLGATESREMFHAMAGSVLAFFAVWYVGKAVMQENGSPQMHLLLGAYFAHLVIRTIWLSAFSKKKLFLHNKPYVL